MSVEDPDFTIWNKLDIENISTYPGVMIIFVILFLFIMAVLAFMFAIAAVAMVIGLLALAFLAIQVIAALFGLAIATPYIIEWVITTYRKAFDWVCDRILGPIAYRLGVLTGKLFARLGKGEWLLAKLGRLESPDQEHDEQNHRHSDENPNQVLHNRSSLR